MRNKIILVIDFGSQYTQLITRRVRELSVYAEIVPHTTPLEKFKKIKPAGIILSGGPMSVYDEEAPPINKRLLELNIPILGICYGLQIICKTLGGKVEPAKDREYGKANLKISQTSILFNGVKNNSAVWMSHGDYLTDPPANFNVIGTSEHSPVCAIEDENTNIYGVQFHPEVAHTEEGTKIIENFLFGICKCQKDWTPHNFVDESIEGLRSQIGSSKVLCALSGGVDSTVAAVLLGRAVGNRLICIHIDNGLMRKNESAEVEKVFKEKLHLNFIHVDASELFLERLKHVVDPEQKRKIIGNTFIEVFEAESKKNKGIKFLVQGTLYPDVIESAAGKGVSATIKTHHNVGGLPEKMNLKLIEPFRELFKDEVRDIGRELNIPEEFLERHPFPGPGLAVRILGEVDREKLEILREADAIFLNEIKTAGLYNMIWQAFTVLLPVQSVGVMGDSRTYENVLVLRAVTSSDGMTADWFRFDDDFLAHVSSRIINKVKGINRVVYDISSKPPSTIEWE